MRVCENQMLGFMNSFIEHYNLKHDIFETVKVNNNTYVLIHNGRLRVQNYAKVIFEYNLKNGTAFLGVYDTATTMSRIRAILNWIYNWEYGPTFISANIDRSLNSSLNIVDKTVSGNTIQITDDVYNDIPLKNSPSSFEKRYKNGVIKATITSVPLNFELSRYDNDYIPGIFFKDIKKETGPVIIPYSEWKILNK